MEGTTSRRNEQRKLEKALKLYRCSQLLAVEYNSSFATFTGIIHTALLSFQVFCFYGAVRAEGAAAVGQAYLGVWGFLTYLQMLNKYAEINTESGNMLKMLQDSCRGKAGLGKVFMKDLQIRGGSAFYFDREIVLTTKDTLLNQTVNLLMLF